MSTSRTGADGDTARWRTQDILLSAPVRGTLATRGDVARPEVGDRRHAGALGDQRRVADLERCAQLGALIASYAIEVVGTQEYRFGDTFLTRFEAAYGATAAEEIAPHLSHLRL